MESSVTPNATERKEAWLYIREAVTVTKQFWWSVRTNGGVRKSRSGGNVCRQVLQETGGGVE